MIPRVLVIAGSDSGGGAGIQADIKTVMALGGYATTAITAITAQNTLGVAGVMPVPGSIVAMQMTSILSDIGTDAIKTGMLGSADVAHRVAEAIRFGAPGVPLVVDPVLVATSGDVLGGDDVAAAMHELFVQAALITPNVPELARLTGMRVADETERIAAARALAGRTGATVLAKGGHADGDRIVDLLVSMDGIVERWEHARIDTRHTHGTGCTLASAIAMRVGAGASLVAAIACARAYVRAAMMAAPGLGGGHGPMGHALGRVIFDWREGTALD